jgi:hypothetical protein
VINAIKQAGRKRFEEALHKYCPKEMPKDMRGEGRAAFSQLNSEEVL